MSEVSRSSNLPSPKFQKNTPIDKIRESLLAYGMKDGGAQSKRVQETTENVLKQAQEDPAVMKGLIQFLNWQEANAPAADNTSTQK